MSFPIFSSSIYYTDNLSFSTDTWGLWMDTLGCLLLGCGLGSGRLKSIQKELLVQGISNSTLAQMLQQKQINKNVLNCFNIKALVQQISPPIKLMQSVKGHISFGPRLVNEFYNCIWIWELWAQSQQIKYITYKLPILLQNCF